MNNFKYLFFVAAMVVASFVPVRVARAASQEAKERLAHKACLSGNYQKGVEILSDLFLSTSDPVYLYNQARCFEQNGRCEEAIHRFREYLRKAKKARNEDRAEAERHIADCQELLDKKPVVEAAPKPEPASPPVQQQPASVPVQDVVPPLALQTQPAPPPEPVATSPLLDQSQEAAAGTGRGLKIAGIACGVVGVGSIATAVYFYTRARSYSDKVSKERPVNPADVSAGNDAEKMQWVFYGLGGAAVATGTVLYLLGSRSGDGGRASVAPLVGAGLAGITAQGSF